jgi:hypothetical protein
VRPCVGEFVIDGSSDDQEEGHDGSPAGADARRLAAAAGNRRPPRRRRQYGSALRRGLAREIRRYRPDLLLNATYDLTYGLSPEQRIVNQADHRAVGIATLDTARDAANRWIFPELVDEGFAVWSGVPPPVVTIRQRDHWTYSTSGWRRWMPSVARVPSAPWTGHERSPTAQPR